MAVIAGAAPVGAVGATSEGEYIIRFADGVDPDAEAAELAAAGAEVLHVYRHVFPGVAVRWPADRVTARAADPAVASVEPSVPIAAAGPDTDTDGPKDQAERDDAVSATAVQSNPPWGLDRIDQRNRPLSSSYTYPTTASGVSVYVVDGGIRANHTSFGGRVSGGYTSIADGRGTSDCDGHGTHVAGTAGSSTYGVAKAVTLVPVRVLDCDGGGSTATVVAGLDYIVGHHSSSSRAVANLSLGGPPSSSLDAAIQAVIADGVTTVVAAGNEGELACDSSPARVPAAITVAATDSTDYSPNWSNYGSCVDIFAPGDNILSASHLSTTGTTTMDGTSMAAPHVAGAAALILAQRPSATPSQVASQIIESSTTGVVSNQGSGSPNRLLHTPPAGVLPPPANDDFAAATSFTLTSASPLSATNLGASRQTGEPEHAGSAGGASVWWRFTPTAAGTVTLRTLGSDFDTVLGVYTGTSVGALTEVDSNDDVMTGLTSEVTFAVTAGTTYRVAVDGYSGRAGSVTLHHSFTPSGTPNRFVGVTPTRIVDSRNGTGTPAGPWQAGQTRDIVVRGGSTPVPTNATAVVLNVTGISPSSGTHLTVWPSGGARPTASNVNLPAGAVRPNAVVSAVGSSGRVSVFNNSGSTHVAVDIVGYFAPTASGGVYTATSPARLFDSRNGTGTARAPWTGGETRSVRVTGVAGSVPTDATAVVLNVTATRPDEGSHLSIWPDGVPRPTVSSLNFGPGETVANLVTVKVGTDGRINVFNNRGNVDVLADVVGYYRGSGSGTTFTGVTPRRVLDSRSSGSWGSGESYAVDVAGGPSGVPSNARAVVMNLTGVDPSAATHLTVYPNGETRPNASNLNLPAGDVRANLVIAKVDSRGNVQVFNNTGQTDIIADVVGYYT